MVSPSEAGALPCNTLKSTFQRVTKDYLLGIFLLLAVVVLWTSSNFVTQDLYIDGYHKPFLVTYLNTSSFTFYLLPFLFRYWWKRLDPNDNILQRNLEQYEVIPTSDQDTAENIQARVSITSARAPSVSTLEDIDPAQFVPLTIPEVAQLASLFCCLWFIANWLTNASLDYTSVASCTVLSSTSSFFTLALGRLVAVESLTPTKIVAVVVSFIGVLLVSLSDNTSQHVPITSHGALLSRSYANPFLGDVLAISAAIFYAFYMILLKVRIRSESRIDMQLFFGFAGAINILALFPVGLILHFTGYEPFELPPTSKAWGAVLINMFITLSSDYILVIAMLKTTPVVATVGLCLTIPLAFVGDAILNRPTKAQAGLGAFLVLVGFGLIGWANADVVPEDTEQQLDDTLQEIPRDVPILANREDRREID